MKLQNVFVSAAMLAIFVLATLNTAIRLVQFVIEVVQTILATILFVARIVCKAVKAIQHLLNGFEWLLSAIDAAVDTIHSSLEEWMVSTVQPEPPTNQSYPLLLNAKSFPSGRTAFQKYAVKAIARSLEPIAQQIKPQSAIVSLDPAVAPRKTLMLPGAATIPSEKIAFEHHAISAIASSLETIVEINAKPLGEVITIGNETELIALSFPGVYVQRTPTKKKPTKSELSKLTIPQLRDRIAQAVKNNNSLVVPKKSVKKAVLVDWLMAH